MGERSTIEGTVENVVFQNEENGYTVLSLLTDQGEVVTVVGCIPFAAAGEGMTVTGVWTMHPVHGAQLTAESVERRLPRSQEDMVAYLSSGIIKGIGPATAATLLRHFKSVKRIREASLQEVTTIIGPAKAKLVKDGLNIEQSTDNQ